MSEKIRVGIAGAGFIGAVHAHAYMALPDVEILGIADPVTEKAAPLAKETSSRVFADYDALLAEGIDILNVCLPPALHLPAAVAAARKGTHVLMEKPIARTVAEADEMIAACREAGVNLMTGFTHHFYPEMIKAREMVQSGVIGKPLIAHDAMSITYGFVLPWYRDKEIAGGGVFMCNAVHGFDRAAWALGQKPKSVCAIVEPTKGRRAEEFGAALAKFDGGVQGNFFQHWGPYRSLQCELQIFGEEGMVHVHSWDSVEVLIGDERTVTHFYKPDHGISDRTMIGMVAEVDEMVRSVREKRPPSVMGEDGRAALEYVLAVYESAAKGEWVEIH
jgi:predicted dehydrogenase